jgi:RNA polymerase sigma factor (sigma-70 family)
VERDERMISAETLSAERTRLVKLCYRLTGDLDAAEDLAQETMLEAIRNSHKLHDPSGYSRWLSAIARNVCMRWNRSRSKDASRTAASHEGPSLHDLEGDYDLDVELERHELVDLLDRAMAMLPPESREVLVESYVNGSPHAETARRLGLTENGVTKRLERGRLRLKRVLSTELMDESVSFGLSGNLFGDWQETNVWCPACGKRKLLGTFTPSRTLWLVCKPCIRREVFLIFQGGNMELFRGIQGYRAANFRLLAGHGERNRNGIVGRSERCDNCGGRMPYRMERDPLFYGQYAVAVCERCGDRGNAFVPGSLVLSSPEGQKFWREHPRIRSLPGREIRAGGTPALLARYESVTGSDRIEGVFVKDTFERLAVYRNGKPAEDV